MSNLPLNIDWQQILLHFFNFVILIGGLYILLYKPIKDFMDKREEHYKQIDKEANDKLADVNSKQEALNNQIANADKDINEAKTLAHKQVEDEKAMKKAVGALRLDLAQYKEMEVFTQFSSDLDEKTKELLAYGQGLMELLKQNESSPYSLHQMVIILTVAMNKCFKDVPINKIRDCASELIKYIEKMESTLCSEIDSTGMLQEEYKTVLLSDTWSRIFYWSIFTSFYFTFSINWIT